MLQTFYPVIIWVNAETNPPTLEISSYIKGSKKKETIKRITTSIVPKTCGQNGLNEIVQNNSWVAWCKYQIFAKYPCL